MRRIFILGFLSLGLLANAQISTDRPTQSYSALTVPKAALQLESGFLSERPFNGVDLYNISYAFQFRMGLTDWVEARISTQYSGIRVFKTNYLEMDNPTFGLKFKLFSEESGLLDVGFLATAYGYPRDGKSGIDKSTLAALFQSKFSDKVSLGWNVGMQSENNRDIGFYTVALMIALDDQWTAFLEPYGYFAKNTPGDQRFNTGLTYLLKDNVQFDASLGNGLTRKAPDYFLSLGASVLF